MRGGTMLRNARVGAVAIVLATTVAPALASASSWHQVTASNGGNTDEVGLLRTPDGTLHVAWQHETSPSTSDMLHTPISPGGVIGTATTIASGWASLSNPALVASPGGAIEALFGGIHTTNFGDPNQDMNAALSGDQGASWTVQPGDVVAPGASAYASPVNATAIGAGLEPFETWYGTLGVWVHAGVSPSTPNFDYQGALGGCCGYDSNIAADAAGNLQLAWYSNATGHLGVWTQGVAPDGSPVGSPVNMPSTSNMQVPQAVVERTPLVARPGGGFFIAYGTGYPSVNRIRLWRVGAPGTTTIANVGSPGGEPAANIATAPDGRLWIFWKQDVGEKTHIFAVRSNRSATRFGAIVDGGSPPHTATAYNLDGSATTSALDVLASFAFGTSSNVSTWYERLLPGLSLSASPGTLHRGRATQVSFLVTDAGDPVKGAHVSAGGHSATTNGKGRATLVLSVRHPVTAIAAAGGYVRAVARLKVTR